MQSKTPPQLRLEELEAKLAPLRKQLQSAKMAVPRAAWDANADVLESRRQLRCLSSAICMARRRIEDPEGVKRTKRAVYAKTRIRVLQGQKARYERDKVTIIAKQSEYAKRRRAARNANPEFQAALPARKAATTEKRSISGRKAAQQRYAGHTRTWTPEKEAAAKKKYAAKPEAIEKKKAYAQRPDVKAKRRERGREKEKLLWRTDPQFALASLLRCRIRGVLAGRGLTKREHTETLIGCTVEALKAHLESRFLPGMTWGNRGEWHIDHVRPCSSFDLADVVQQRLCFHYTNLQPLWWLDNLKKGSKLILAGEMDLPQISR